MSRRRTLLALVGGLFAVALAIGALRFGPAAPLAPPLAVVAPATPTAASAAVPAWTVVDGARAREHLLYLGDPARQGRLTGSQGFREAAEYVAARFREMGLVPLGDDGTFLQRFSSPLVEMEAMPELAIVSPSPVRFVLRRDFTEGVGGFQGGGIVEAKLVAIPGGSDADYGGVEVRGKVALVTGLRTQSPVEVAARQGARAVILVARDPGPELLHFSYIPSFVSGAVPTVIVREEVADRLLAASGKRAADLRTSDAKAFETAATVRVAVPLGPIRQVEGINVVGLLAALSGGDRFVVVGGHLDGVGADPDGTVYPGANDNASGPAVIIEVARALVTQRERLRRSVVFVAFAGEEEGSRGAEEFLRRAGSTSYRPANETAFLNLDVAGCCGDVLVVNSDNGALAGRVAAAAQRRGVAASSSRGGGSDHVSFARAGVPAAHLLWRDIGPIHTTRDTVDLVDAEHLRKIGEVAVDAVLDLAAD